MNNRLSDAGRGYAPDTSALGLELDGIDPGATCFDLFLPEMASNIHAMYRRLLGACPCESGRLVAMLRPTTATPDAWQTVGRNVAALLSTPGRVMVSQLYEACAALGVSAPDLMPRISIPRG